MYKKVRASYFQDTPTIYCSPILSSHGFAKQRPSGSASSAAPEGLFALLFKRNLSSFSFQFIN